MKSDGTGSSQLLGPPLPVISGDASSSAGAEIGDVHVGPKFGLDESRNFGHRHAEPTRDAPAQIARRFCHHRAQNMILPHFLFSFTSGGCFFFLFKIFFYLFSIGNLDDLVTIPSRRAGSGTIRQHGGTSPGRGGKKKIGKRVESVHVVCLSLSQIKNTSLDCLY